MRPRQSSVYVCPRCGHRNAYGGPVGPESCRRCGLLNRGAIVRATVQPGGFGLEMLLVALVVGGAVLLLLVALVTA
ncbi:hypothetical protein AB0D04_01955 [Streptomyces sp. NPDC048483]|uniref:hypothetical protein n=1 Tax=Streptomyces sp. NPDC048483 TaxID=3154927 RepID=UPI0034204532